MLARDSIQRPRVSCSRSLPKSERKNPSGAVLSRMNAPTLTDFALKPKLAYASIGGVLLSIAGFLPWALAGRSLTRALGEAGMYAVCALVFLAASAPLLHRLLVGGHTLRRFYALFTAAFIPYSVAWTAGWMALRGHPGSAAGLALGCLAMAVVLCGWFGRWKQIGLITLTLLLFQVPGYFAGGWAYEWLGGIARESASPTLGIVAKLSWGLFFGWGLGGGLAVALQRLQR